MGEKLKRFLKRRVLPFILICLGAFVLLVAIFWLKCAFVKPAAGPLPTIAREHGIAAPDIGEKIGGRSKIRIFRIRSGTSSGVMKNVRNTCRTVCRAGFPISLQSASTGNPTVLFA